MPCARTFTLVALSRGFAGSVRDNNNAVAIGFCHESLSLTEFRRIF
jgi:hypothetical protein